MKIPVTLIYEDIKNTYGEIKGGNLLPYLVTVGLIFDSNCEILIGFLICAV